MTRFRPSDTVYNRTRARLLRHLPGKVGQKYTKKHDAFRKMDCDRAFDAALETLTGKIAIDLGANIGTYTARLAAHADRVIAFEPDPWTAMRLRENVGHLDNVEVVEAAAGTSDDPLTMYRAHSFDSDPAKHSESTSTFAEKVNVDLNNAIEARQVDFPAFLETIDGSVGLLKIDIEGGEVVLLEALFDHPVLRRIDWIFCETHETRLPILAKRYAALRRRAAAFDHPKINLDWR